MTYAAKARRLAQLVNQLARSGPATCASSSAECLEAQSQLRHLASQLRLGRGFQTGRSALAESTGQASAPAQGPPYAIVGGALAVSGGLLYMLFGGSSGPAAIEVADADSSGVSEAHIGPHEVETHRGDKFSSAELHGDFALIYFGASSHPDTVSELERLAEVVNNTDRLTNMHYLNPVFISIDPKDDRDKVNHVVSLFDTNHNRTGLRLLGISGDDTQKLHKAALQFGDRLQKPVDKPDTTFFFVNPEGEFVKAYSGLSAPREIADDMTTFIKKYKTNNPSWHGPKKVAKRHA